MNDEPPDVLAALRRSVSELASACPGTLRRMRVRAGDALVEVEWSPGPESATDRSLVADSVPPDSASTLPGDVVTSSGNNGTRETHDICASTVGTFFHGPEPGAAPFVMQGDIVEEGQQVGILEVMKLMTPVESDRAGQIVEIIVPDAQSVEYGQRLISLAPVPPR